MEKVWIFSRNIMFRDLESYQSKMKLMGLKSLGILNHLFDLI
ncbi:unnamed protein product [Arabidopsis halleri]